MFPQHPRLELFMTSKITPSQNTAKKTGASHPGMMGDGTEEQNLNQTGNPDARIKKKDVDAAFTEPPAKK